MAAFRISEVVLCLRVWRRARRRRLRATRLFPRIALRLALGLPGLIIGLLGGGHLLGSCFDDLPRSGRHSEALATLQRLSTARFQLP